MSDTDIIVEHTRNIAIDGGKVLLFDIDSSIFGVEIEYITEIIQVQPITIVPKVPYYIKGVINIRGKVIPVMSIRIRFGKPEVPFDEKTCIIVIEYDGVSVGLIVDSVRGVLTVPADAISAPPDYKSVNANRYIRNIIEAKDGIKLLLDCRKIIVE